MIKYQDYSRFKDLRAAKDYIMREKGMTDRQAHKYLSEKVPKESYYQRKIIEWLDENAKGKAFYWKATQGAYSRSGIPDVCVIIGGRFYGLEVKRPFFGVVSQNQKKVKREIEAIGGKVYIVTYVKEVADILLPILEGSKITMAKREYDDNDRICGNCLHHKPSWETGHLAGWHCDNFMADAYGCSTEYDDGEECPDFESKR